MKLSKTEAEEGLIKVGRMTREQLDRAGANAIATVFVDEVKRNYSAFFSDEPNPYTLKSKAARLFSRVPGAPGIVIFDKKPETVDNRPRMSLSLADAEKKLIKRGAVTKEKIEEMAKRPNSLNGRDKQWMTKLFLDEVKKDYSAFFPSEPEVAFGNLKKTATKLFKYGGTQKFFIKRQQKKSEE